MSVEPYPTGHDPLRRLGTMTLLAGVFGLLAIVYSVVNVVRGRERAEEWMVGVGCCLLIGAAAASLIQGMLRGHQARIEALEKRAAADATRPPDGTPS